MNDKSKKSAGSYALYAPASMADDTTLFSIEGKEGGHFVPKDKVEGRIPRTLMNVRVALPLCDQVRILDNSNPTGPFRQVAIIRQQVLTSHTDPMPDWAAELLGDVR